MNGRSGVPLADISTNFFAGFILMLLVALTIGGFGSQIEGEMIERRALRGEELVDLLYARRDQQGEPAIDLFDRHIEIHGERVEASRLPETIAAAFQRNQKALLFVFRQDAYAPVTQALMQRGIEWREMSVPRALRDPRGAGWSHSFLNLVERAPSRDAFKDGLARLLAGGGNTRELVDRRPSSSPPFSSALLSSDHLRFLMTIAALIGCALVAVWAERRRD